jgi:hypothetical protein
MRDSAGQLSIQRMAEENAHLLFLTAYDLARINGYAVGRLHARYAIDDDFVLARRGVYQAH